MNEIDEIYSEIAKEEKEIFFPPVRKQEKKSRAKTYIQLITEPYEPCFTWNEKTLEEDRQLLYLKANQVSKQISDTKLRIMLEWGKGKNLNIRQFIKALNKVVHSKT